MSMKLNVGLSRKIGESNYGSRGASCQVEIELDTATLSQDPAGFQQRVHEAFAACRQAIQEELSRTPIGAHGERPMNGRAANSRSGGQAAGSDRRAPRGATENQVKAIRAISHRAGVQLESELSQRYGVHSPQALSLAQASQLIDALKEQLNAQPIAG